MKERCGESEENHIWIKQKHQQRDRKPIKEPKRNSGGENHNNGNEEFTRGIQRQIWMDKKKKSLTSKLRDRVMEIIKSKKQK